MLPLASMIEMPKIRINKASRSKTESGVVKVLKKVRPDWPREDIILQRFTEGFSNIIYGGYVLDKKSEMILVKVYGCEEEADKSAEILTMRLFAARHFGSRIFATFANGYVYEYAPGVPLNYELSIDRNIYPIVARRVGEMHRVMKDQANTTKGHVFDTLRSWLTEVPTALSNREYQSRYKKELPSKFALERELSELEEILGESSPSANPLIFCHGDLNPSNIIYDASGQRKIVFIDLEFSGPNFVGFEIAQHFMTFVGGDLNKVGRNEFVPAKEFQMRWCRFYLMGYKGISSESISQLEVESLWLLVQKFSLVFCLQEIIWSLVRVEKMAQIPGFDAIEYAVLRYQQYHRNKFSVLNMCL